jgi:ferredoxin
MLDLEKAAGWLSSVTPVRVESGLCTRARSPRSICNACVAVCPAACDSCANGCASDRLLADALQGVAELYPGAVTSGAVVPGAPARAATTGGGPALDEALAGQDRRAFLGGMARSGGGLLQALLGDWFVKPKEPERTPIFDLTGTSRRREILAAALATRPAGQGAVLPEQAPCVSEACTFCPVCSRLCPSGALKVAEAGDCVALQWQASRCTDCGLCREVCPAHAMSTGERISPERFLAKAPEELMAGTRATCTCGTVYWQVEGGPATCMACRVRAGM